MIRIAATLLALAAGAAQADEIGPMQAKSIALGGVSGVAYYTEAASGYEVVATLAAGEEGTPMRFVATLSSGQRIMLSVPQADGEAAKSVEIARVGDKVLVTEPNSVMN
jgi:hypothetical protein